MSRRAFDRRDLAAIAIGGLLGALVRWLITDVDPVGASWFTYAPNTSVTFSPVGELGFPWRTLIANLAGTLGLGVIVALRRHRDSRVWLAAGIGFCGSLTTFSTFAFEIAQRLRGSSLETGHVTVGTDIEGFTPVDEGLLVLAEGLTPLGQAVIYAAVSVVAGALAFIIGRSATNAVLT